MTDGPEAAWSEDAVVSVDTPAIIIGNKDATCTEYTCETKDTVTAGNTGYPDNET